MEEEAEWKKQQEGEGVLLRWSEQYHQGEEVKQQGTDGAVLVALARVSSW